ELLAARDDQPGRRAVSLEEAAVCRGEDGRFLGELLEAVVRRGAHLERYPGEVETNHDEDRAPSLLVGALASRERDPVRHGARTLALGHGELGAIRGGLGARASRVGSPGPAREESEHEEPPEGTT